MAGINKNYTPASSLIVTKLCLIVFIIWNNLYWTVTSSEPQITAHGVGAREQKQNKSFAGTVPKTRLCFKVFISQKYYYARCDHLKLEGKVKARTFDEWIIIVHQWLMIIIMGYLVIIIITKNATVYVVSWTTQVSLCYGNYCLFNFFFLPIESPLLRADLVEEGSYLFGFRETIAWKWLMYAK